MKILLAIIAIKILIIQYCGHFRLFVPLQHQFNPNTSIYAE